MEAASWTEVRELFCAAVELPPKERATYVERSASTAEVRAEVERLLAAHERPGETFGEPGAYLPRPLAPGERIGHYTLLRVLGAGGMGTVYEAQQDRPQRQVALKTLRHGFSPERLQRFLLEAEVLGTLRHPGIAQIYESGTHEVDGELFPWFAMELVAGARDIVEYAEVRSLPLHARLALFLEACGAVQHGHQKGVIHRDLKAGNILVDSDGHVKIIDFGVARATLAGELVRPETLAGQLVGTLATMSPEQLAGDPDAVDARSDVYSLGVVLHELVAGEPPYELEGVPLEEALRRIREAHPARTRDMPQELYWILLRALAKEPERRYASASELAADLQRFATDDPVLAGPPSRIYVTRKFVARHTVAVAAAATVVLALVAGIVGTSWQAAQARAGRRAAETQGQVTREIAGFLDGLLRAANPELARGKQLTARELLDDAAARIDGAFPGRPEVEASVRATVGHSYRGLGLFEESERHLRRRHELVRGLVGDEDARTIEAATDLARVLVNIPRLAEAEELARATLARSAQIHGEDDARTIELRTVLADALRLQSSFDEAERLLLEGLELVRARSEPDPAAEGQLLYSLGSIFFDAERLAEAERYYREALALSRQHEGDDDPSTLTTIGGLSGVLLHAGKFDEAESLLDEVIAASLQVRGKEHLWTTWARTTKADLYVARGEHVRAEQEYRAILAEVGSGDFAALTPLNGLATSLWSQRRFSEAIEPFRASLALAREAHGIDHPDTLMIQANLAGSLRELDELDEALELLEAAQEGLVRQLGESHPNSLAASLELGRVLRDLELEDDARVLFEAVLAGGASAEVPRARMYVEAARQELGWLEER